MLAKSRPETIQQINTSTDPLTDQNVTLSSRNPNTPITSHPKSDSDLNSTSLFVYGFPPTGGGEAALLIKILAARHIQETTDLKIVNMRKINFIKGKVWDANRCEFDTGKGANIMVKGILSQSHINQINENKKTKDIYHLKYYLSDKQLNTHQKISLISNSSDKNLSETSNKTLNETNAFMKSHKYIPPPLRSKKNTEILDGKKLYENINRITGTRPKIITTSSTPQQIDGRKAYTLSHSNILNNNKNKSLASHSNGIKIITQKRIYQIPQNRKYKQYKNKTLIDITSMNSPSQPAHPNNDAISTKLPLKQAHPKISISPTSNAKKLQLQLNNKKLLNGKSNKILNSVSISSLNSNNNEKLSFEISQPTIKQLLNDENAPKQSLAVIPHLKMENINEDEKKIGETFTASSQNHTLHKNIDNKSIKSFTPITHPLLPIKSIDLYDGLPNKPNDKTKNSKNDKVYSNKNSEQYTTYGTYDRVKDPTTTPHISATVLNGNKISATIPNENKERGTLSISKALPNDNENSKNITYKMVNSLEINNHGIPQKRIYQISQNRKDKPFENETSIDIPSINSPLQPAHPKNDAILPSKGIPNGDNYIKDGLILTKSSLCLMYYDIIGGKMLESISLLRNNLILNIFLLKKKKN